MIQQIIILSDSNEFTDCVNCGCNLRGNPVPKAQRVYYGKFTNFSRLEGLEMDAEIPGLVTHWQCPDCNFTFPRFQ